MATPAPSTPSKETKSDIQPASKKDESSSASKTGKDSSLAEEQKKLAEKALEGLSSEELLDVLSPEAIPDFIQRGKILELKKAKDLGKTLTEIGKLRKEYEEDAKQKDQALRERVLGGFKEIRERVAKEGLTLPDAKVEDLDKVLLQAQKGLEAVYGALIKGIEKGKLSAATLIDNHQLLYGRYVDSGTSRIAHGGELIRQPHDVKRTLKSPDQASTEVTLKHSSVRSYAQMDSAITQYGWSWLASAEASGAAFIGSGVGAASAAFRLQRAGEESRASSQSNATTRATQINSRYVFVPKAVVVLDTKKLRLSPAADESLLKMQGLAEKDHAGRKELIKEFYQAFGTHICAATTLGGVYRLRAKAESSTAEQRKQLESTVASATEWAAAVTASYLGTTGAVTAKLAGQHAERTDSSNINKLSFETKQLDVEIETSVNGGEPGLPVDMWRQTLQYNSTWAVINRDELYPVWKLINDATLAPEFEEVWVQEIFAKSLTGLPEAVIDYISKDTKTVAELKRCLDDLAPRVELRVFRDSYPIPPVDKTKAGYHGDLEVKVHDGYKLIGGGARVHAHPEDIKVAGKGNFLTASYPKDKYTWKAKCKDHGNPCRGSLEVWAVGLYDPNDKWDVKIFDNKPKADKAQHQSDTTRVNNEEYSLTGGGACAEWKEHGSLLTKSCPLGNDGWTAQCKDLAGTPEEVKLVVYAIGIAPNPGNTGKKGEPKRFPPMIKVFSARSEKLDRHATAGARVPQDYTLICGGACSNWHKAGHYLVGSSPDEDNTIWEVESWDHVDPEESSIIAYAIGFPSLSTHLGT